MWNKTSKSNLMLQHTEPRMTINIYVERHNIKWPKLGRIWLALKVSSEPVSRFESWRLNTQRRKQRNFTSNDPLCVPMSNFELGYSLFWEETWNCFCKWRDRELAAGVRSSLLYYLSTGLLNSPLALLSQTDPINAPTVYGQLSR